MYPDSAVQFIIGQEMKLTLKTSAFLMIAISIINNTKATEQMLESGITHAPQIRPCMVTNEITNRKEQTMEENIIPQASSIEIRDSNVLTINDVISQPNSPILDSINEHSAEFPIFSADSLKIGLMQEFMIQINKKLNEQTQELNILKTEGYNQQKFTQELQERNLKLEEQYKKQSERIAFWEGSFFELISLIKLMQSQFKSEVTRSDKIAGLLDSFLDQTIKKYFGIK